MKKLGETRDTHGNITGLLVEVSTTELANMAGSAWDSQTEVRQFVHGPVGAVISVGALFRKATELVEAWENLAQDLTRAVKAVARLQQGQKDTMPTPKPKESKT